MSINNDESYNSVEKSALKEMEAKNIRDDNYKQDILNRLKNIESNTSKLMELVREFIKSK